MNTPAKAWRRGHILAAALMACLMLATAGCVANNNISGGICNGQGSSNGVCNKAASLEPAPSPSSDAGPGEVANVFLAVGSEDLAFFNDPGVLQEFRIKGLRVFATGYGSNDLASHLSPHGYDAFMPSSQVIADMAEARLGTQPEYYPFSTQLRVFTWKPLVPLLQEIGVINDAGQFDIAQYVKIVSSGTTWSSIPGNSSYANPNQVLLKMTDPAKSNSGAMFLAAAGYVIYTQILHQQMIYGDAWVSAVSPVIASVVNRLGELPETTNDVYLDYRSGGINGVPLALGYESEWKGAQPPQVGPLPADAVSLPLDSPVTCDRVVFAFTQNGQKVGSLLLGDPVLQGLAQKYGFDTGKGPGDPGFDIPVPDAHFLQELIHDVVPYG